MRKFLVLLLLSSSIVCFAGDKDKSEKPAATPDQKETILKLERAWLDASVAAAPYEYARESAKQAMMQGVSQMMKDSGVDTTKWQFNFESLEYEALPQKTDTPPPAAKK